MELTVIRDDFFHFFCKEKYYGKKKPYHCHFSPFTVSIFPLFWSRSFSPLHQTIALRFESFCELRGGCRYSSRMGRGGKVLGLAVSGSAADTFSAILSLFSFPFLSPPYVGLDVPRLRSVCCAEIYPFSHICKAPIAVCR